MKLISIHIILIALITFFGCKSDKEDTVKPNLNYNYAGLQTGNYIIYNVDSIFYDDFTATSDTFHFQIKEHLNATFTDLQGDPAYRIERFKKYPDSTHWELVDVWQSKITTTNYQKVEENDRFVKLIFPVRANKTWNGNNLALRGGQNQNCTIELASDEGDNNDDFWRVMSQHADSALAIDHYATGSWVEQLRITTDGKIGVNYAGTPPSETNPNK